jgi:Protein of unknown function (DUF3467)
MGNCSHIYFVDELKFPLNFNQLITESSNQRISMADEKKDTIQQSQINIELSEEIAEGIYSNLAMIAHSNSEFVIDFIKLMPGVPKARVKARVIVTPEHAKRLLLALKENIDKYETNFGTIKQTQGAPKFPMNFGGTMGEA